MKKNTKIKIASAEDILSYLRKTAVDGISNKSKKDVARHFGYKSSNGEGFLSNFKMLEEEGLIEDVSSSKKNGRWKVDMTSSFSSRDVKKKKNNNSIDLNNPLSNVNLEYLNPIDFAGRKYIPLTNVADALGVDKHAVYNAASSSNRLVFPYTRTIPLDDDKKPNSKKSIEVEGLSFLFDRLKKHVDKKVLSAVVDYVNSISDDEITLDSVSESQMKHKSTDVNVLNNNSSESEVDKKEIFMENQLTDNTTPDKDSNFEEVSLNGISKRDDSSSGVQYVEDNATASSEVLSSKDDLNDDFYY